MVKIDELKPMLLDERPLDLDAPGWIYELKMDGYRVLVEFDGTVQPRCGVGADARPKLKVKRKGAIPPEQFKR